MMRKFIVIALLVTFVGVYHMVEYNHGVESTREDMGYYGPGY